MFLEFSQEIKFSFYFKNYKLFRKKFTKIVRYVFEKSLQKLFGIFLKKVYKNCSVFF